MQAAVAKMNHELPPDRINIDTVRGQLIKCERHRVEDSVIKATNDGYYE